MQQCIWQRQTCLQLCVQKLCAQTTVCSTANSQKEGCAGEMVAVRREKQEEYLSAPDVVGEVAVLSSCLPELATRYSPAAPSYGAVVSAEASTAAG